MTKSFCCWRLGAAFWDAVLARQTSPANAPRKTSSLRSLRAVWRWATTLWP